MDQEKPRYLLPEGCKDLIDVLRQQEEARAEVRRWQPIKAQPPGPVILPDAVSVAALAAALGLKPFLVIEALIGLNIFATAKTDLDFDTAARVCAIFGISPLKSA